MGGDIIAESAGAGKGSSFTLQLPLAEPPDQGTI
jgi:signal transduction histidine kinase